jgi:hypothetical protein
MKTSKLFFAVLDAVVAKDAASVRRNQPTPVQEKEDDNRAIFVDLAPLLAASLDATQLSDYLDGFFEKYPPFKAE